MITKTMQTAFTIMQTLGNVGCFGGMNLFLAIMPNASPATVQTEEIMMM